MTPLDDRSANARAVHFSHESFATYAHRQLANYPLSPVGVCQNPCCSRRFAASRDWQLYCSDACRKLDRAEMRRVGEMAAPALLAWRMGKYATTDDDLRALGAAGRRFVGNLQSAWYADRRRRMIAGVRV